MSVHRESIFEIVGEGDAFMPHGVMPCSNMPLGDV